MNTITLALDPETTLPNQVDGRAVVQCGAIGPNAEPCIVFLPPSESLAVDFSTLVLVVESTPEIREVEGLTCRVWRVVDQPGRTVCIHRVAVPTDRDASQFAAALHEQPRPRAWDWRGEGL